MLNQEMTSAGSISRSEYNRQYYLKRKQELLAKKKKRSNVFQLFSKVPSFEVQELARSFQVAKILEITVLFMLVTIMTAFLISEAGRFYIDASEKPWMAYLKAGTIEVLAILFSFSRGQRPLIRRTQRVFVVLLSVFTLTSMSVGPIRTVSKTMTKFRSEAQVIAQLEDELHQKESLQSQLIAKQWLGAARKYEKKVDELRGDLSVARQKMVLLETPSMILNALAILLTFRLLVVIANLICFHRLAELFDPTHLLKELNSTSFKY